MTVTIPNPDAPFDSPAYDGAPADAHKHIEPGTYLCSYADGTQWGTLVVTETESHLVVGEDTAINLPWADSYGNKYFAAPLANTIKVGADIMLIPGTIYTYEDLSNYPGVNLTGTSAIATDLKGNAAACGVVKAAKIVGDRVHLTLTEHPVPEWTLSIPADTPVYAA